MRVLIALTLTAALAFAGAAPAAAAQPSTTDVGIAACDWGATRPYKHTDSWGNSEVRGRGWSAGCTSSQGSFTAVLQHHRAWGWSALDDHSWYGNGTYTVRVGCDNASNFEYRTMLIAETYGGYSYRPSGSIRLVC